MKRTIAAILAADVAGFSRLVAEDEDDTLARLQAYSRLFREEVTRVGGRVFNTAGDAILAEFPSAVEALRAGIAIQEQLRALNAEQPPGRRILFRMGLTIGDVVETDNGDLLGDGVNVAARLEGIAEPGGICISRSVHEAISARVAVAFRDLGPRTLKNIPRPVHAFRVVLPSDVVGADTEVRRRRWPRMAAAAVLLLIMGVGLGLTYGLRDKGEPASETEYATAVAQQETGERTDLLTVAVAKPHRACFRDEVWLSGTLVPKSEVEVGPETEGLRVRRVLAKPLETVAAGQALAELARPDQPDQTVATLKAPVAGTIGHSTAVVGATTTWRASPLFRIVAQGVFDLAADVPIGALAALAEGQTVTVTPLGLPDLPGRIRSVATDIDAATQLGRARVQLATGAELRQGQYARGIVTIGERCGLGVPSSAILRSAEGSVVYVSNEGRVEGRLVTTGLASGDDVEIRNGLDEADTVVVRAAPFVREGDVVRALTVADRSSE